MSEACQVLGVRDLDAEASVLGVPNNDDTTIDKGLYCKRSGRREGNFIFGFVVNERKGIGREMLHVYTSEGKGNA